MTTKRKWKRIICLFLSFSYFFQLALATTDTLPAVSSVNSAGFNNLAAGNDYDAATAKQLSNLNINSDNFGLSGPLSFGVNYDTLLDTIFNVRLAQKLAPSLAVGFIGEYGVDQYRLNSTLGWQLYPEDLIKFSAEYLSQVLPFSFDSGDINQRVSQSAYGLRFQHSLKQTTFQNINGGIYWAQAPNTSLSTLNFIDEDGLEYVNQRNIAGATSQGLDVGTTLGFTETTSLDASLNYDSVNYDTELTSNTDDNSSRMGGMLRLNQIVNEHLKFSAEASNRAIYNTYGLTLNYIPNFAKVIGLEIGASIQRLVSSNDTPSSNNYGIQFGFFGDGPSSSYALAPASANTDLTQWIKTPAIYMDRVLAIAEQITTLAAPTISSISPNTGTTLGGNTVTINGANFVAGSQVLFGTAAGSNISIVSSHQLTVTAPASDTVQTVDLTITNPNGTSTVLPDAYSYTVSMATMLSSVTSSSGPTQGGDRVTLTGNNLLGTNSITFDGKPATDIVVVNDTTITATTPKHDAEGLVDVVLSGEAGSTVLANAYTYQSTPLASHRLGGGISPPSVTSIAPTSGVVTGGTTVIITGTDFTADATVSFGATAAASVTFNSDTSLTVTSPANSAGYVQTTVDITVTTPQGTSPTSTADQFTYLLPPAVNMISPRTGPASGGTNVEIIGNNFTSDSTVTFGATPAASITFNSSMSITAVSPSASAGNVYITVTTPAGSASSFPSQFTYVDAPTVSAVAPNSGPLAGGTDVVITGTNFVFPATVNFGGTPATNVSVNNSTTITATSPAGSAGTVDITVTTVGGTSGTSTDDEFTYLDAPTVTAVAPDSGPLSGGTDVTITGSNFTSDSTVSFGGTPAASVTFNSDTSITATSPSGSAGTVDITVTTPGGTSSTSTDDEFTYLDVPTVTTVAPNSGPLSGGTDVAITGTNFTSDSTVNFGGTAASSVTVNSDTSITATSPSGSAGTVDITVTTPGGTSATSTDDEFTYLDVPSISNLSPNFGPEGGGTVVTITGANFASDATVSFGGTPATGVTVNSDTSITATSPARPGNDQVFVTITTAGGTSSMSAESIFSYQGAPIITSFSPSGGPLEGGTTVALTGANFINVTAVSFGGTPATSFTVQSASNMRAVAPAHSAGAVTISVTADGGTGTSSSQYTYSTKPYINSISPNLGSTSGGTSVTLTGGNFTGATAVNFGSASATSFTINSANQITAISPARSTEGAVSITVTGPTGTSLTTSSTTYNYFKPPTITAVNPNKGSSSGGTTVTITGTNFITFAPVTAVKFGSTPASSFVVNSATKITAVSPAGSIGTVHITAVAAFTGISSPTTSADEFTYGATPNLVSLSPSSGSTSGGNSVTLTGTGLTGTTGVTFGGTSATIESVSDTSVVVTAPAGSPGIVDVILTNNIGSSTLSRAYNYIAPNSGNGVTSSSSSGFSNPSVDVAASGAIVSGGIVAGNSIASATTSTIGQASTYGGYGLSPVLTTLPLPAVGPTSGGTLVTLEGSNLSGVSSVTFGNTEAQIVSIGHDSIQVISPAHVAGKVDINVVSSGKTTLTSAYTYQ